MSERALGEFFCWCPPSQQCGRPISRRESKGGGPRDNTVLWERYTALGKVCRGPRRGGSRSAAPAYMPRPRRTRWHPSDEAKARDLEPGERMVMSLARRPLPQPPPAPTAQRLRSRSLRVCGAFAVALVLLNAARVLPALRRRAMPSSGPQAPSAGLLSPPPPPASRSDLFSAPLDHVQVGPSNTVSGLSARLTARLGRAAARLSSGADSPSTVTRRRCVDGGSSRPQRE